MRQLVLGLILATAAAAVAAVTATALVVQILGEQDRLRSASESDLAALVSLAETTSNREDLLRGIARTPAGREGRLAVHLGEGTVGSSRLTEVVAPAPPDGAEVPVEGGTVLVRAAGPATVEAFVPAVAPGATELRLAALLLGVGALAAGAGAVMAVRRLRPVQDDLAGLADGVTAIGHDETPPAPGPMHVPETAALAAALATATARFAEARSRERKLAADLSHRLRTPLTALALDAARSATARRPSGCAAPSPPWRRTSTHSSAPPPHRTRRPGATWWRSCGGG
ncbi:hypothetical protein BJF90_27115 [Pseudonocardia sp. CNS-004]|nr:hypothetical protein BJF90_27115 [Pseudonocardia sp. CNS-004]